MQVSVVLSVYNSNAYLETQLASLRKQSQQPDEVLIIDDCSTDDSYAQIKAFIENHNLAESWRLIRNQQNLGWKKSFMEGIAKAQGELIFLCDQDDIWRLDKIAKMAKIMQANPQIQVLATNYRELSENGSHKLRPYPNDQKLIRYSLEANPDIMAIRAPGCSYAFRKSFFKVCQPYWTKETPHDALLWRLALVSDGLYWFRDDLLTWRKYQTSTFKQESQLTTGRQKQVEMLAYSHKTIQNLRAYLLKQRNPDRYKLRFLEDNLRWINLRTTYYEYPSLKAGLALLDYRSLYTYRWQYYRDLWLGLWKG